MLFELQFPNPVGASTYRQHQYVDQILWQTRPDEEWRPRDYVWCEADGVMFVRRSMPTNDLAWYPVQMPPQDAMITFQLQARCRSNIGEKIGHPIVRRGARPAIVDPMDNLAWLERTAQKIGLKLDDAEVDMQPKKIDRPVKQRAKLPNTMTKLRFTLVLANFTAVATVQDTTRFELALTRGVGDSKAFGCGFIHFWQRQ